jgi:pyruvate dehydrogenase E1 component beta subunit
MSNPTTREITYLEAVREAMVQEMRSDPEVFLIGEDVGTYGGAFGVSMGMLQEFGPERVIDTPIAEAAMTGICVGAAPRDPARAPRPSTAPAWRTGSWVCRV